MMNSIGKRICNIRKSKALTQEELADLANINLRTIQRIENEENVPRGKTLQLICQALEIEEMTVTGNSELKLRRSIWAHAIDLIFLILLNILLMSIIGFLTLDSNANLNSMVGALILSFLMPIIIVFYTPKMSGLERMLKFGSGFIFYIVLLSTGLFLLARKNSYFFMLIMTAATAVLPV